MVRFYLFLEGESKDALRDNEVLVDTMTVLLHNRLPQGSALREDIPLRLKVLPEVVPSIVKLSVTCAIYTRSASTLLQTIGDATFELIPGVHSTPTEMRSTPHWFAHNFAPAFPSPILNFPIIATLQIVQNTIERNIQQIANQQPGTQRRRVAITNAANHWFTVCYELTNTSV